MKSRLAAITAAVAIAAALLVGGTGAAQASTAPPGGGTICTASYTATNSGSSTVFATNYHCGIVMANMTNGTTVTRHGTPSETKWSSLSCWNVANCGRSETVGNPAGLQTFDICVEYSYVYPGTGDASGSGSKCWTISR